MDVGKIAEAGAGWREGTVGPYAWRRQLAQGRWGTLHEAWDVERRRAVLVRTVQVPAWAADADTRARFHADVQAASQLAHPNLAPVLAGDWQGLLAWTAFDQQPGEPLDRYLARVGKLPALQALALALELLSALDHAHARGVLHGPVGPADLLVTRTGCLQLSGYAVARLAAACSGDDGFAPTPADDVRAAAAVAYRLLAGAAHDARGPRPVLPDAVAAVFARALGDGSTPRYAGARELADALQAAVGAPQWDRSAEAAALPAAHMVPVAANAPVPPVAPVEAVAAAEQQPPAEALVPVVEKPARPHRRTARRTGPRSWGQRLGLVAAAVAGLAVTAALVVGGELAMEQTTVASAAPQPLVALQQPLPAAPAEEVLVQQAWTPAAAVQLPPAQEPSPQAAVAAASPDAPVAAAPAEPQPEAQPVRLQLEHVSAPRRAGTHTMPDRESRAAFRRSTAPVLSQRQSPDFACRTQQMALAREICRVAQCATAEFRGHPVCQSLHAEQRRRDLLADQALRTR